jgi:SAM-dependent methyltransferase
MQQDAVHGETPALIDCLPHATRVELHLDPTENVSSHEYDEHALAIIDRHRDGLVLDCGAGQRNTYYANVVNYEIVDYDSTDVLGAAERLPFKDESFDAVLSLNVLEHVKDPFQAAREIMRVMKPGAELMCVAPFLQPLHGYPHHYYNMTAQGLENLFLPLRQRSISLYGAMHPIWALTWFLDRYAAGLADAQRERFLTMSVADLLAATSSPDCDAVVSGLSLAARSELAAAHALKAIK